MPERPPARVKSVPPPPSSPTPSPGGRAAFFGRPDWLAALLVFIVVGGGYLLTLAPEVTLEDSGELATASFYAGVPHSPGYPVWTLYTWLWTALIPWKNIAWRVALGEAFAGTLAASVLGLLVSRGAGKLIDGIDRLRELPDRSAKSIRVVAGFVAGLLLGFNGFMWSQSVIVEVYSFGVLSLMLVLACLMRWIYAPDRRGFLYAALFLFGICFTNHQTLVVAAIGIEVTIAAADFRLGRHLFLGNSILYLMGWLLTTEGVLTALSANPAVYAIFHAVGLASLVAYAGFARLTRASRRELLQDALYSGFWISLAALPKWGAAGLLPAAALLAGFIRLVLRGPRTGRDWGVVLCAGVCWVAGASFYFYLPLASMTNPPMNWSYPRTLEGFIHAVTRGQYEKTHPTDLVGHPGVFGAQLLTLGGGVLEEFNWVCAGLALLPLVFLRVMRPRERAWIGGLLAIYGCLGVLLLILLNPPPDRSAQQLHRVFFTASHTIVALLAGYGLALTTAELASSYARGRKWGLAAGTLALLLAAAGARALVVETYLSEDPRPSAARVIETVRHVLATPDQYALPVYAGLGLLAATAAFLLALGLSRQRLPLKAVLAIYCLLPGWSILTHWADNEQRGHWFGYWYGHDMLQPPFKRGDGTPLYPPVAKDAIVFGGTDAGRFCPTYMIFCESFIPHGCQPAADQSFDRRDVCILTQNALADPPYQNYIRAQYNPSRQTDPPFFSDLARRLSGCPPDQTNFLARITTPIDRLFTRWGDEVEHRRRTASSLFTPRDFPDLPALARRLTHPAETDELARAVAARLRAETRARLTNPTTAGVADALAGDFNKIIERETPAAPGAEPLFTPQRLAGVTLAPDLTAFLREQPRGHSRVRLNRRLLEAWFPGLIRTSPAGVYPDREIQLPTPEDATRCYAEYRVDVQRRMAQNQLEPGESVSFDGGTMNVGGQVAIGAINSLIARVIFDHNPDREFYLEESVPMKWTAPYLTPAGLIMKLNRQPVAEITEEMASRDHLFWDRYAARLIGDSIPFDSPIKDLVDWAERVYLRRDYTGFRGDRRFLRDDQAQKCFSKLRTSIGSLYARRIRSPNTAERARVTREAEFALRQAFALCPFHIETVAQLVQLLANLHRFDDALLVAGLSLKLDPLNGQTAGIIKNLETWKAQEAAGGPGSATIAGLEQALRDHPDNFQGYFDLAAWQLAASQTNRAIATLNRLVNHPKVDAQALQVVVQALGQIGDLAGTQAVLEKLVRLRPEDPDTWYNLAAFMALTGRPEAALQNLRGALELDSRRRQQNPAAPSLLDSLPKDPRFNSLRTNPEFKQIIPPSQ